MSRRNPFKRSVDVPAAVLAAASLAPGEKVLAATSTTDDRWLLVYDEFDVWRVAPDGSVELTTGAVSTGQGHETGLARIAATPVVIALNKVDMVSGWRGAGKFISEDVRKQEVSVQTLLDELDPRETLVSTVVTTQLKEDDLLNLVAANFGLRVTGSGSKGISCQKCDNGILTVRNNILWANDEPFSTDNRFIESHNVYWSNDQQPGLPRWPAPSALALSGYPRWCGRPLRHRTAGGRHRVPP